MNIFFSDNIKRLRRERGITQETLANILCISAQSISKWERGDSLPDIVMLPAIANYFGVTIDALLGNDKILAEERIQNYINDFKEANGVKNDSFYKTRQGSLEIARWAYEEFPYDFRIVMLYVNALNIYGGAGKDEEIIRLCKMVIDNCDDESQRTDATYFLQGFLSTDDKSAFLKKFIIYGENDDWYKIYPLSTDEGKIIYQHTNIADKWWHLNMAISYYGSGDWFSREEKIDILKRQERIFYAVFDKDDLGEYTSYVGDFNAAFTKEYLADGKLDKAAEHFDKAVDGYISYVNFYLNNDDYEYKNILINKRPYIKWNSYYPNILNQFLHYVDKSEYYKQFRGNEQFELSYCKLRKYCDTLSLE